LQEQIQHCTRVINGPPQPEFFAPDLDADLVQEPLGTSPGFSVPQFLSEERCELDVPLAERLVADLDAALLEQFLDITLAEGKAVVEPKGVLDDAEWETVAVRLTISHGTSAYLA